MDEREAETDGQASELASTTFVSSTEDDDEEDEREESLGEERAHEPYGLIACTGSGGEVGTVAIGGEDTRIPSVDGRANNIESRGGERRAKELRSPIGDHLTEGHAAIDKHAK